MIDPQTPAEWQEAVNAAEFYLSLDSARMYGLISMGPIVNAERCSEILRRGRELGYRPAAFDKLCEQFIERKP